MRRTVMLIKNFFSHLADGGYVVSLLHDCKQVAQIAINSRFNYLVRFTMWLEVQRNNDTVEV